MYFAHFNYLANQCKLPWWFKRNCNSYCDRGLITLYLFVEQRGNWRNGYGPFSRYLYSGCYGYRRL